MNPSTPGLPVHYQLLEFTQIHVHQVSDAIQPSHPLLSPSPPAPNPSHHQGLFQWVNSSHEVAKLLSFSFSISPSSEHPGLISFRMDWLDLLAVHGTLKSLLQHYNSKVSIFRHSAFFTVYCIGRMNSESSYWYRLDFPETWVISQLDQIQEILMSELDPEVMDQFYAKDGVTAKMSFMKAEFVLGSVTDITLFIACGDPVSGMKS